MSPQPSLSASFMQLNGPSICAAPGNVNGPAEVSSSQSVPAVTPAGGVWSP
jgi:hypothetical protein